jgi:hypothetical protein
MIMMDGDPQACFQEICQHFIPYSGLQNCWGTGSYKPLVTGITAITVSVSVIHFEVKEVSGHFLSMKVCEELTTLLITLLYN